MAWEILEGEQGEVFICNTTDIAFGPIMEVGTAQDFADWLEDDPRIFTTPDLADKYHSWYDVVFKAELRAEEYADESQ
jgi:hypothetical protein